MIIMNKRGKIVERQSSSNLTSLLIIALAAYMLLFGGCNQVQQLGLLQPGGAVIPQSQPAIIQEQAEVLPTAFNPNQVTGATAETKTIYVTATIDPSKPTVTPVIREVIVLATPAPTQPTPTKSLTDIAAEAASRTSQEPLNVIATVVQSGQNVISPEEDFTIPPTFTAVPTVVPHTEVQTIQGTVTIVKPTVKAPQFDDQGFVVKGDFEQTSPCSPYINYLPNDKCWNYNK